MDEQTLPYSRVAPRAVERPLLFSIALWLHLSVLGFLCADALHAILLGVATRFDVLVAYVFGAWLIAAVFYLFRRRAVQSHARYLLAFYAGLISIAILALAAPLVFGGNSVYQPGISRISKPEGLPIHGVQGASRFSTNQLGFRGSELPATKDAYRVITVGGSTTACSCLDDTETWPYLMMDSVNSASGRQSLWVANAGMDGMNTANHLNFLTTVPALRTADMLTFLVGANDLNAALAFEGRSSDLQIRRAAARIFPDNNTYPYYRRLGAFKALNRAVSRMFSRVTSHEVRSCEEFAFLADERSRGPFIQLPDLTASLREYADRILELANLCKATGQRCAFLTQPSIWRDGLSAQEEARLWLGWVGARENRIGYGRPADLAKAMLAYNNTLLSTCSRYGLECYDLASSVPRTEDYFSDDFHFTEKGARQVAQYLASHVRFAR